MEFRKLKLALISVTVFLLCFVVAYDTLYTLAKVDSMELGSNLEEKEVSKTEKETEKEKESEKDSDETDELFFENFFLSLSEKVIFLNYSTVPIPGSPNVDSYITEIHPPPPRS